MPDVTVAIPWRPQPDRLAAHSRVLQFWQHHGFPVVEADSDPKQPFSLAEARNNAVRKVTTPKVIVADADTVPDIGAVYAALANEDGVTWPFHQYRHIPNEYATNPDLMTAPVDRIYRNSVGGCFVTTVDTYWALGGMDERFDRRWGYEDNAFHHVVTTLSTEHRIPGILFSFNHAADREMTHDNPNRHRADLYKYATQKPELMRELIKR
jgi:hypothetical protein